jgi:tetratricopeptide (TPR) repeat protein
MADLPHDVQFALSEFDRSQLPEAQRGLEGDAFREAVREHLAAQFSGQGGAAQIIVTGDRVIIRWKEEFEATSLSAAGAAHLREGQEEKGIGLLRVALDRNPEDADALYNLGIALSERGQVDEAAGMLERLTGLQPDYPGSWTALGVAHGKAGRWEEAIRAFEEAVALDGGDGLARLNLGAVLSQCGRLAEGVDHLKAAVVLRQEDPQAWLNLAMNLEQSGNIADAETSYGRVIALDAGGLLAERAEQARNRISGRKLREGGEGLRSDVVAFCREALQMFASMPSDRVKRVTMEIAMLGTKGLSVQNPTARHTLRSLPGEFSGLQLLCYEYTGFQFIDPSVDIGFDIAVEYEEARRQHEEKPQ